MLQTGSRVQNVMFQDSSSAPSVSEEAYQALSSYLLYTKSSFFEVGLTISSLFSVLLPSLQDRYGGVSFGSNRSQVDVSVDASYAADINASLPFLAVNEAAKAWYSFKGYHALPTYLNVLSNAVLRAHLPAGKDPTRYGETEPSVVPCVHSCTCIQVYGHTVIPSPQLNCRN